MYRRTLHGLRARCQGSFQHWPPLKDIADAMQRLRIAKGSQCFSKLTQSLSLYAKASRDPGHGSEQIGNDRHGGWLAGALQGAVKPQDRSCCMQNAAVNLGHLVYDRHRLGNMDQVFPGLKMIEKI